MASLEEDLRRYGQAAENAARKDTPAALVGRPTTRAPIVTLRIAAAICLIAGIGATAWWLTGDDGATEVDRPAPVADDGPSTTAPPTTSNPSELEEETPPAAPDGVVPEYLPALPARPSDPVVLVPTLLPGNMTIFDDAVADAPWTYAEPSVRETSVTSVLSASDITITITTDIPPVPLDGSLLEAGGADVVVRSSGDAYYIFGGDDCDAPGQPVSDATFATGSFRHQVSVAPPAHCLDLTTQQIAAWLDNFTIARPAETEPPTPIDEDPTSDDPTPTTGITGTLPTAPRIPDDTTHDPATCWLASDGLAFYSVDERFETDSPPCIRAGVTSRLRLGNRSGTTWTVDLGATTRSLPSGSFDDFEGAVLGDFLEIGVHHLSDDLPDIWVIDPQESPFGAVTAITLRSFGPLRTNMTVAEAESVLGVDLVSIGDNESGCTFVVPTGPSDPYAPQIQVFGNDEEGRIVRIETYDPTISTPSGIRVGQPEATLPETYGDQLLSNPDEYAGPEDLTYEFVPVDASDADFRLMFSTVDDTIQSIWTATTEAAYLAEGCS